MATNLNINEKLLKKAHKLSHLKTKRETVDTALREYVQKHEQRNILKIAGSFEFRPDWDYKADRAKR